MSDDTKFTIMASVWCLGAIIISVIEILRLVRFRERNNQRVHRRDVIDILVLCVIIWPAFIYEYIDGRSKGYVLPGGMI